MLLLFCAWGVSCVQGFLFSWFGVLLCFGLFVFFPSVWVVVLIFALQGGSSMACILQSLIVQDCKKILVFLKTEI